MSISVSQVPGQPVWQRALQIAVLGAIGFPLAGCLNDLAGYCRQPSSDVLLVAENGKCKARYAHGDMAKYVVFVLRPPTYGEAKGQGPLLHYIAKPGFRGEDQLTIRVERRGIGHVQWETRTIKVRVGSSA